MIKAPHMLASTLAATFLVTSFSTPSEAGAIHSEWPDAIVCHITSDNEVEIRVVLALTETREGEMQMCGFPPNKAQVKRATYSLVQNCGFSGIDADKFECTSYMMWMCTETSTDQAEPEIAPKDTVDCGLGRTLKDMKADGQTVNFN